MNFTILDWSIVGVMMAVLVAMAFYSNRYTKNVSHFLAAGRSAGRYMMTMASGMVFIGAVNVVAMFELYNNAGFTAMWWVMLTTPVWLYVNISGLGVYRFRETRSLTIAQFLETRYSRGVRVGAGVLAWVAGLINFGLFPAIGARFFIVFCNLPKDFNFLGMEIATFPLMMFGLLVVSLFFVFLGGQIAVMVTDCLQGMFTQIAAIVMTVVLFIIAFNWGDVCEVLSAMGNPEAGKSMINPLRAAHQAGGFTPLFFVISSLCGVYSILSNMQTQAYVASAKSAHEYRIGSALNQWRWQALLVFFMVLSLCALVVLKHPDHAETAAQINAQLESLVVDQPTEASRAALRGQLRITTALGHIMPIGLVGIFVSIMLAALISTYDSFMHTWGAVFLQDVVMPFRKKPFETKQHMALLRWSILSVAVFAFVFSLLFKNTENILMYFAMVNSPWLSGAGAIIFGGLYWKRGSDAAAKTTMWLGAALGIAGIVLTLGYPAFYEAHPSVFGKAHAQHVSLSELDLDALKAGLVAKDATKLAPAALIDSLAALELEADSAPALEVLNTFVDSSASAYIVTLAAVDPDGGAGLQKISDTYSNAYAKLKEKKGDAAYQAALKKDSRFMLRGELDQFGLGVKGLDTKCPLNPQWFFFWSAVGCVGIFVLVSLMSNESFNMDKLLHRGKYQVEKLDEDVLMHTTWYEKLFGITKGFEKKDKPLAYLIVGWFLFWLLVFLVVTPYAAQNGGTGISEAGWLSFWKVYMVILFVMAVGTTIWFSYGSTRDIINLFSALKKDQADDSDDGFVRHDPQDDHAE